VSRVKTIAPVLFACLFASARPARAAEPPDVKLPDRVPPPQMQTFKLDNGLAVTILPFGDVPKVDVRLAINTGNVDEGPKQTWLSDLAGLLLELGTSELDAVALQRRAGEWGGEVGVTVEPDTMWVGGSVLSEHAPALVELISQIVEQPRLPEKEIPRLQGDLIRQVTLAKSQPQPIADAVLAAEMYPGHAYGRMFPTEAMIRSYDLAQVKKFLDAHVHAGRAHLYIAGKLDPAAAEKAARAAFADWRGGKPAPDRRARPRTGRAIHFVERAGAIQSTMRVALPGVLPTHPDYVPLLVTNRLLGGYFSSRITSNIREQKGYTYSPFSTLTTRDGAVHWVQQADVKTDVTGAALKEIEGEMMRLGREPPPAAELDAVVANLVGTFLIGQSSRQGRLSWRRFLDLHGLPRDFDYVAQIRAVTPEAVSRMARKYIAPARMTVVIVGDSKQVLPQLEGIARTVREKSP
jgi:zinc protease